MKNITQIISFLPAVLFAGAASIIGIRNPELFDAPHLLKSAPTPSLIFLAVVIFLTIFGRKFRWVGQNLPGLILILFFLLGYFQIASILNKPDINTNNIYFSADSASWYERMAGEDGWNVGTRGVHPLAHIIFRPLVALFSILTGGDRFHASLIFLTLIGAGCVFLMWKIVFLISGDKEYSILFASLLGLSSSHLIFASILETYIFSAFLLLLFILLLFKKTSLIPLVLTGVATLGITVTNIVQQALTFLFLRKDIRQFLKLFSLILFLSIGINLLSKSVYPVTEFFFLPENLSEEQRFSQEINMERIELLAENILAYNIAAPQPYLSIRNEMPRFNFLPGTIQNYIWFGLPALFLWLSALVYTGFSIFSLRKNRPNNFEIIPPLSACVMFNAVLHAGYGVEPFLYSPDWTYALLLAMAVILQNSAQKTWFRLSGFILIMAVAINNLWFIYLISRQVSSYIS